MVDAFIQLHAIQREFDNSAADLEKAIGTSICVNCGHCCSVNTPSWMTIEALNAVSVYAGRLAEFQQAAAAAEGWLLDREKFKVFEGVPIGFPKADLTQEWHRAQSSPCPFMVQKRCLIYEARPLSCRAYGVFRKAGDLCRRHPGKGETLTQRRYVVDDILRRAVTLFKKITAEKNPSWVEYGQVPTFFFRAVNEAKFRSYIKDNRIASAKLCGTGDVDTTILWQPQLDALNTGISPDLVAVGKY